MKPRRRPYRPSRIFLRPDGTRRLFVTDGYIVARAEPARCLQVLGTDQPGNFKWEKRGWVPFGEHLPPGASWITKQVQLFLKEDLEAAFPARISLRAGSYMAHQEGIALDTDYGHRLWAWETETSGLRMYDAGLLDVAARLALDEDKEYEFLTPIDQYGPLLVMGEKRWSAAIMPVLVPWGILGQEARSDEKGHLVVAKELACKIPSRAAA